MLVHYIIIARPFFIFPVMSDFRNVKTNFPNFTLQNLVFA